MVPQHVRNGLRIVLDCREMATPRALARVRAAFRLLRGRNAVAQVIADQPAFGEDLTLWCGIFDLHIIESHPTDRGTAFTVVERDTGLLIRELAVNGFWTESMPRAAHLDARTRRERASARPAVHRLAAWERAIGRSY